MKVRIGIELSEWLTVNERVALACWAEDEGFDSVYAAEVADPDAFVVCALGVSATSRIRFGTGIIQIGPRTAPMIASSTASVDSLAPGRFGLGIGVSSEAIVSGWHGLAFDGAVDRARETVGLLRQLLAGGRSKYEGKRVRSNGYRLAFPPATPPKVNLAALNHKMMQLAAEIADGVWLNFLPVERAAEVVRLLNSSAVKAGKPRPEILLSIPCDVTDDAEASRADLRQLLAFYISSPAYRSALSSHGYEQEMTDAARGVANRDRDLVARALTDRLVDSVSLIGDRTHCRERLAAYVQSGVTSPSLAAFEPSRAIASFEALSPAVANYPTETAG